MIRALVLACAVLIAGAAQASVRIKDIATVQGVRENQLVGYGLVVGLQGTGDSLRNAPFTEQSVQSMLDRMAVNVRGARPRTRNVAAVMITAELPPFAGRGSRIDVQVSAMGDASSLMGGTLIATPLMGGDGQVYAVAQGSLAVTGFNVSGQSERITQGVPTSGRIANGALVERTVGDQFNHLPELVLELKNPDFRTAVRMVDAINAYAVSRFGVPVAVERDLRSVALRRPKDISPSRFIAEIETLSVEPDAPARVVIDERTGTIVIGARVTVSTVAVSHGNLTVRVTETPSVSQPAPFSQGVTTVAPQTSIDARQENGKFAVVSGTNLQTLINGLNQLGLRPSGVIAILQAIKSAGALQADIVVQ